MAYVNSLHCGSDWQLRVSGYWSRPSSMSGSRFAYFLFRRVYNNRTYRSQISSSSLNKLPSTLLTNCDLRSIFPSKLTVLRWSYKVAIFLDVCLEFEDVSLEEACHQPYEHSPDSFQLSSWRMSLWGCAWRIFHASYLCFHAFISTSNPGSSCVVIDDFNNSVSSSLQLWCTI